MAFTNLLFFNPKNLLFFIINMRDSVEINTKCLYNKLSIINGIVWSATIHLRVFQLISQILQ